MATPSQELPDMAQVPASTTIITSSSSSNPSQTFHYVDRDKIDAELTCPICKLPFMDPVVHRCENTFCYGCIESRTSCPLCREEGDLKKECVVAHKTVRNLLGKLKVQCEMCKNVFGRGELKDHQVFCLEILSKGEKKRDLDQLKKQNEFLADENEKLEQKRLKLTHEVALQQEELEKERQAFQQEVTRHKLEMSNKPIHLNVEGTVMTVALSTFMDCPWEPNNLLKKMFSGEHPLYETPTSTFQDKVFFIDCPLKVFEIILGWLRYGGIEDSFDFTLFDFKHSFEFKKNKDSGVIYKLIQTCLYYELEKLIAVLKREYCIYKIPVSQSFISVIDRKNRTGIRFEDLNFNGFSFDDIELTECEVTDCDLSNLKSGSVHRVYIQEFKVQIRFILFLNRLQNG